MPSGHLITYQTFFHFPCVFRLCTLRKFREVWLKRNSFVPLCMDSNNIWNIVQNLRYLTLIFQNPPLINNIRFFYEYYYKFPPLSQSPLNFLSFLFFYTFNTFTSRNSYRKLKTLTFCFDCTNFHLDDQIIPTNDWTWNNMDPFVPRPNKTDQSEHHQITSKLHARRDVTRDKGTVAQQISKTASLSSLYSSLRPSPQRLRNVNLRGRRPWPVIG